jgi:hypothetical protein
MARKKETKNQTGTISPLEIPVKSELSVRLQKISEQTGLSSHDLLQKWILQEESLIGLVQRGRNPAVKQPKAQTLPDTSPQEVSGARKQKKAAEVNPGSPKYRQMLLKRAAKLKKEGMTLVGIAKIFNDENLQTVSGKGKWYPGSLVRLLNSKA